MYDVDWLHGSYAYDMITFGTSMLACPSLPWPTPPRP